MQTNVSMRSFPLSSLTGNNYMAWSTKMEMFLRREKLWDIVQDPPEEYNRKQSQEDEKALATIVLSLEDDQLVYVRGIKTAHKCWTTLRSIYVRSTMSSRIMLSRKLYRARLQTGGSMQEHLQFMRLTFQELEEKGMSFPESQKACILLSSLDSSYDTFVLTLEAMPEEELTLAFLTGRLLEEQEKRTENLKARGSSSSSSSSKTPQRTQTEERKSSNASFIRRCHRCGSEKHLQRDCAQERPKENKRSTAWRGNEEAKVSVVKVTSESDQQTWLVDSGASQHVANDPTLFSALAPTPKAHISLANGASTQVQGQGEVYIPCLGESLNGVLCVPELQHNLLSVSCLCKQGYKVEFVNNVCNIKRGNDVCAQGIAEDNLYMLQAAPESSTSQECMNVFANNPQHSECIHVWHRRLAHYSYAALQKTIENAQGLKVKKCNCYLDCAVCKVAKSVASSVSKKSNRKSARCFQLVHADLIGPLAKTYGGARFILTLVDDYSRYGFVYLMKGKDETFNKFKQWVNFVERRYNQKVGALQTDRGTEFLSGAFQGWLKQKGIQHRKTNPYAPAENGTAERRNRTLQTVQASLLADSGLGKMYWGEATLTANYLINRLWTSALGQIPYYVLYGRQPSLAHLKIFGSTAWVHIPKAIRRKGQPKAKRMIFLGYEASSKSYRFTEPGTGRITFSRSASFLEQDWKRVIDTPLYLPEDSEGQAQQQALLQQPTEPSFEPQNERESGDLDLPVIMTNQENTEVQRPVIPPRRSERSNKGIPAERFSQIYVSNVIFEPQSYKEVLEQPSAEQNKWRAAMDREMQSMHENKVFTRCQLPPGKRVIDCRWVYKQKVLSDGNLQSKARLVAKGFTQKENVHFGETYAPTVKGESVRIALVLAANLNLKVKHYDFTTAYLNANLEEELYMSEPPGYETKPGTVWRLSKAIYGLRQSAHNWNRCLDSTLQNMGFRAAKADSCVYTLQQGDEQIFLLTHVDDLLIIAKTTDQIEQVAQNLMKEFQLKDLGEIRNYLGVEIQKVPGKGYILRQQKKIEQLLESLSMQQCKPAKTPMATDFQRDIGEQNEDEVQYCDKEKYQSAVGSLLYLAQWSRPDIAGSVNILSRHVSKPTERHWQGLKRVLRYLQGTKCKGLIIQPMQTLELVAYSDASWADEIETRKSTSGLIVTLAGSLVGWRARRQSCVSISSSEAEFGALSEVCTELIWYQQLLKDLQLDVTQPFTVWEDSETCLAMATSQRVKGRSKHVDIRYCNVREAVQNKLVKLIYCPSEQNVADIMTKPLGTIKHSEMCSMMGMSDDVYS